MPLLASMLLVPSVASYSLRHCGVSNGISPRRGRRSPVMLDSSSEIAALQLQIKILELQAQLQSLQDSQPPAPVTAAASAPVPSLLEPVAASLAPLVTAPVPSALNVPTNPASMLSLLEPAAAPLAAVVTTPVPSMLSVPTSSELILTAPLPTAARIEAAATAVASVSSLPAFMDPKAGPQPERCFGDECVKTVLAVPAGESDQIAQALASGLGLFIVLPLAYLAATKFAEFVDQRYDEIGGEAGGGEQTSASNAPSPYPWRNE